VKDGAIWLHRKIMESDIWTTSDQTRITAISCLLLANWKEQNWFNRSTHKPQVIFRGQFVTTWENLAKACRLSVRNVRTAIENLSKMQFLTRNLTGRVTVITILNYDKYQQKPTRRVTDSAAVHRQVTDSSLTWLEEVKTLSLQEREEREEELLAKLAATNLSFEIQKRYIEKYFPRRESHEHEDRHSESIFEQAARRKREKEAQGFRGTASAGEVLKRFGGMSNVQSPAETD